MVLPSKGILFYLRILLIAVYFVNGIIIIQQNSIVYDEMDHWSYGKRILKRQPEKIYTYDDASAMPVSAVNAIPRAVEQLLNPRLSKTDGGFSDIMHGRYVTLLVCLLAGLFIYRWSKELFGETGGTLSLFLFVFCPNLNAHATLLTTDAYGALFTLATFYYFRKFLINSGWKYFILFSLTLGLSQLVKQSLTHLVIVFFLLSLIILIKRKTIFTSWRRNLLRLIVLVTIVGFIINAGFLFNGSGKPLNQYEFASKTFNGIKSSLSFMGSIPIPFPAPYIQGLDYSVHMDEIGPGDPRTSGQVYILGEKRKGEGFWYYYFVLLLFKTPLSVLIMFLIAISLLQSSKNKNIPEKLLLLFPIAYFIMYFSFFL
jgi:4-amino-4-deoxy-L-arabinose transferase-like glycosyltransferase